MQIHVKDLVKNSIRHSIHTLAVSIVVFPVAMSLASLFGISFPAWAWHAQILVGICLLILTGCVALCMQKEVPMHRWYGFGFFVLAAGLLLLASSKETVHFAYTISAILSAGISFLLLCIFS